MNIDEILSKVPDVDKRVLRVQTYIGSTPKDYHPVKLSDREGVILIEV